MQYGVDNTGKREHSEAITPKREGALLFQQIAKRSTVRVPKAA